MLERRKVIISRLIARLFSWWLNPPMGTSLFTALRGRLVGTDPYGNRYFVERGGNNAPRRWVLYNGEVEASKIPPEWHAWLHHTVDEIPTGNRKGYSWEKPHLPNLTGTSAAYKPPRSLAAKGERPRVTGDYEPWQPS